MKTIAEKEFKIKGYTKKELGILYFPENSASWAWNKLRKLLLTDEMLVTKIGMETECFKKRKWITPKHVEAIVEHIGEP